MEMVGSLEFTLVPAKKSDRKTISNLIQLYLYDMASDSPFKIEENGEFEYNLLDDFWEYAYLLRVQNEIAGFALVISRCPITGNSPCWFMAEFFVLRYFRRRSLGQTAFHAILARHPGRWHIANVTSNRGAGQFWSNAIPEKIEHQFNARHDNMDWLVREFTAANGPKFERTAG
jgi:predicted acetyltransferase